MKVNNYTDWFYDMKVEIIDLVFLFQMLKKEFLVMFFTNSWILTDPNLAESFSKIKEIIDVSNNDLAILVEKIKMLDQNSNMFYVCDLKDEFEFIKENIHLEASYITNMIKRMILLSIPGMEFANLEKLEEYEEIDISCYNQMKINNDELKRLRKERRDYFE